MTGLILLYAVLAIWAVFGGVKGADHLLKDEFPRKRLSKSICLFFMFGPIFWFSYATVKILWIPIRFFKRLYIWTMKD